MNELKLYVDSLFRKYKGHLELKEEILGNLEAKVAHLMRQGMDEKMAIAEAKNSITSVEHLIDGNITVRISQFQFNAFQLAFLYIVVAWVITIPFALFRVGILVNYSLLSICLILGVVYIVWAKNRQENKVGQVNIFSMIKTRKILWGLWILYIVISWGYLSALFFGSNVWFGRPVKIDGPYQFGVLMTQYALPFISIVIPLIFNAWMKIIGKHEVSEHE